MISWLKNKSLVTTSDHHRDGRILVTYVVPLVFSDKASHVKRTNINKSILCHVNSLRFPDVSSQTAGCCGTTSTSSCQTAGTRTTSAGRIQRAKSSASWTPTAWPGSGAITRYTLSRGLQVFSYCCQWSGCGWPMSRGLPPIIVTSRTIWSCPYQYIL